MKHKNSRKVGYGGAISAISTLFSAAAMFTPAAPAAFGTTAFWAGANTAGTALGGLSLGNIGLQGVLSATSLAATGITGIKQQQKMDEAAEAERRRAELQRRIQENQAQQARIQQLREARIRQGQITGNVSNAGVVATGTSPFVTGTSAIASQYGSNIGNINTQLTGANAVGQATSDIYQATGQAQQWKDLGGFAENIFNKRQVISSGINSILA